MSIFNNQATVTLLEASDIFSSSKTIQDIWSNFTNHVSYDESDSVLNVLLKSIDQNIIRQLRLSNSDVIELGTLLTRLVDEINAIVEQESSLTEFLTALTNKVATEFAIKDDNQTNNKINRSEKDATSKDELSILLLLLQYGLVNEDDVQSLLGNQTMDVLTTKDNLMGILRKDESPSDLGGRGIQKSTPLTLKQFGTNIDDILNWGYQMFLYDIDSFPTSVSEMKQLVFPEDTFKSSRLFIRDYYAFNLMNKRILSAVVNCIGDLFEMDVDTALYIIRSRINQLARLISQLGKTDVFLMSQVIFIILEIRNLKLKGPLEDPTTTTAIQVVRKELGVVLEQLKAYYLELNHTGFPTGKLNGITSPNTIPTEVSQFITDCGMDIVIQSHVDNKGAIASWMSPSNQLVSLENTLSELLTEVGVNPGYDLYELHSTTSEPVADVVLSSPIQSGIEQAATKAMTHRADKFIEVAKGVHESFSQSLLDSKFNDAAYYLMEATILRDEQLELDGDFRLNTDVQLCLETLNRDISTYGRRITMEAGDINRFEQSAKSHIGELLR